MWKSECKQERRGHLDDGNTTGKAGDALVELLPLIVLLRDGHQVPDLGHAGAHGVLRGAVAHDGGALLADRHLGRSAQHLLAHLRRTPTRRDSALAH